MKTTVRIIFLFVGIISLLAPVPAAHAAYCTAKGIYQSYEWINRIDIGAFNNTSGANSGYGDFVNQVIEAESGGYLPLTLYPGFRSGSYTEYWRVWIDFNKNEIFSSDELVYSGSSPLTINTSIAIPSDALPGTTRLRVAMGYGRYPDACSTFTYGEVEDYSIDINGQDLIPPEVVTVSPADNSSQLSVATTIRVEFSEAMDSTTLSPMNFILSENGGGDIVDGMVAYDNFSQTATFYPGSALDYSTVYVATISTGVADVAGNNLMSDFSWQFTTGPDPAFTPPVVTITSPQANAQNVTRAATIQVYFSKSMNPSTINTNSITVSNGNEIVSGNVAYRSSSKSAVFTPDSDLDYSTTYTAVVSTEVLDTYGNPLEQDYAWSFTTVPYQLPYCSSRGVNTSFIRIGKVKINNFTFWYNSASVNGYINDTLLKTFDLSWYSGRSLALTPSFSYNTYTVYWKVWVDWNQDGIFAESESAFSASGNSTVTGYLNIAQGALPGNTRMRISMRYGGYASSCEQLPYGEVADYTVAVPTFVDTLPPTITGITPIDNSSGVSPAATLTAVFSEAMNAATINASTFLLSEGSNPVPGTVSWDATTKTATFTPTDGLLLDTLYTATITTGATDSSGNPIAEAYAWTFKTKSEDMPALMITGYIEYQGSGLSDATVSLIGTQSIIATTDANGHYLFTDVVPGSYTIKPSYDGLAFTPDAAAIDLIDQDLSDIDFTAQIGDGSIVWGFDSGTFSGFTTFKTNNGDATFGIANIVDVDGDGQPSDCAYLKVGCVILTGEYAGGGFYRNINLGAGNLNVTIDTLTRSYSNNGDGGIYELYFDGELVDSYSVGTISAGENVYQPLEFFLENVQAGQHELRLQVTRKYMKTDVISYVDNIEFNGSSVIQ